MSNFKKELTTLLNKHSKENESDTPDYILAEYLIDCLNTYSKVTKEARKWYGEGTILC